MCCVSVNSQFNLSHESLTSLAALAELRELRQKDPIFWDKLFATASSVDPPDAKPGSPEDVEDQASCEYEDDHAITSEVLRNHITYRNASMHGGIEIYDGTIIPASITETLNEDAAEIDHDFQGSNADIPALEDVPILQESSESVVLGRRTRVPNKLYASAFWEKH